jgi:ankyrin repeat protein
MFAAIQSTETGDEILRLLLDAQADVSLRNRDGFTAQQLAEYVENKRGSALLLSLS